MMWGMQVFLLFIALLLLIKPLGIYIAHVLEGKRTFMTPLLLPIEKLFYVLCAIDTRHEMSPARYFQSLIVFSFICFSGLFFILLMQVFPVIDVPLAFNTAASFITSTNWQSFTPETTVTNQVQQIGFTVQNFLSAAIGLSVMAALARALGSREERNEIGHFWMDMIRSLLYIFLPLSFLLALFLISQGVIQNFDSTLSVSTLESGKEQILTMGPVASQTAIKQLGTNGGGFFMANAAHPFENPTPLSDFIQLLAMLLIPAALTITFGRMVKAKKQGWVLFGAMMILFIPALFLVITFEQAGNPLLQSLGLDSSLGNMEGKELRFGTLGSSMWAVAASATSTGSLNASLDSFMPLSSLVTLALIQFGEVVWGGIGSGICGMIVYVLLTVFIAGLMIGRTPEYLGKKIGTFQIKMASLIILIPTFLTLTGTAIAVLTETGQSSATNFGAQGFSQILYAFTSVGYCNGSSLGGINASSPFYNIILGLCMLLSRFGTIAATLALAGSFAKQKAVSPAAGTLRTDTPLFTLLLICVIIIGTLNYVPALALGPVAEHLLLPIGGSG